MSLNVRPILTRKLQAETENRANYSAKSAERRKGYKPKYNYVKSEEALDAITTYSDGYQAQHGSWQLCYVVSKHKIFWLRKFQ